MGAFINHTAAASIRRLREERGLSSPEALARDIKLKASREPWGERGTVDAWTIRRIERAGYVPGIRIRFVIAHYFGTVPHVLWDSRDLQVLADAEREAVGA